MRIRLSDDKKVFNVHSDAIPYLSFDMLDRLGVPNLFTTRYRSWDAVTGSGTAGLRVCVMKGEDESVAAPHVIGVRSALAEQLGSSIDKEYITDQKHTSFVNVVTEEELGPLWPGEKPLHRQYVDGMVTDVPGALLTVFGGDCPPVYIADPVRRAAGLVHAGWRGTLGRIPEVAIAQMTASFGCDPGDMYAAIGPGICRDCYEMGDEVYDAFAEQWGIEDTERVMKRYEPGTESEAYMRAGVYKKLRGMDSRKEDVPAARYHLDLREANRLTLLKAGIPEDHIAVSNVCTMCNVDTFYSYRGRRMENEQAAMMVNSFGQVRK